jgi:hypothetical protein
MERGCVVNVDGHIAEVHIFAVQESLDLVAKIDKFSRGPLGVVERAAELFSAGFDGGFGQGRSADSPFGR